MRRLLFLLFLVVAACSGDDDNFRVVVLEPAPPTPPAPASHAPWIVNLELSLDSAMYMEGDGKVAVTAVLEVADDGLDLETLTIRMSNGVEMSLDVSGLVNDSTGSITQEFDVSTTEVGTLSMEFSLFDTAGDSETVHASFMVKGDPYTWQERLSGLPYALNDVTTPGFGPDAGFVAVGDAGTIMTSEDGVTWTEEDSGTDVDLNAVSCWSAFFDSNNGCYVAGDAGTVLYSSNLRDWSVYYVGPNDVSLKAIYPNPFADLILAGGTIESTDTASILRGNFVGDPWTEIEPTGQSGQHITGISQAGDRWANAGFQFVATLEVPSADLGRVLVSDDGLTWVEVFISDGHESTYSMEYYQEGVWAGGTGGRIYLSLDGVNWMQIETPAAQSTLVAISTGDSMLMAHGLSPSIGMGEQIGVATSDGGQTWQEFVIGTAYEPRGLAYSDGRWVSVGQSLAEQGRGVIFTTE